MSVPAARRASVLGLLAAVACSGDSSPSEPGPPPTPAATVQIAYAASTTTDPAVQAAHPICVQGVGFTHIHPSWRGYPVIPLTATGALRWEMTFNDVPIGPEIRFRINDPNGCVLNATGAVTTNITANGVALIRVVQTPGSGPEPGLAFTVDASGRVTP